MVPQIRKLGVTLLVLFSLLFVQLNNLQLRQADRLRDDPRNTRAIVVDFSRERGRILAGDGSVLVESLPAETPFKRLRHYRDGPLWAPVTGFFSFNYGTDGVERTYNRQLAGKTIEITNLADLIDARPQTNDVQLTLLPGVQRAAANALGRRRGAVVALDPRTGAVLAMVSTPTYDPNVLAGHDLAAVQRQWAALQRDPGKPMLPRAHRERYPPGSTFKVVTAAAALQHRPDLASKAYPTERSVRLRGSDRPLPNFGGSACGGTLDALMRVSCNTGFARLAVDMGAEVLRETAEGFGFDARPPLDLPAVAGPRFPDADEMGTQTELGTTAIGQLDVAASPLLMALVACAPANGGVIMKPHVMRQVVDEQGRVAERYEPSPWRSAMGATQASALRQMMVQVVQSGTGRNAAIRGVSVAGKTGTAQTVGNNAHAWFIGFAPADAPRVAVAVIIESQRGLGDDATGGAVAAPVARAVMQAALEANP